MALEGFCGAGPSHISPLCCRGLLSAGRYQDRECPPSYSYSSTLAQGYRSPSARHPTKVDAEVSSAGRQWRNQMCGLPVRCSLRIYINHVAPWRLTAVHAPLCVAIPRTGLITRSSSRSAFIVGDVDQFGRYRTRFQESGLTHSRNFRSRENCVVVGFELLQKSVPSRRILALRTCAHGVSTCLVFTRRSWFCLFNFSRSRGSCRVRAPRGELWNCLVGQTSQRNQRLEGLDRWLVSLAEQWWILDD